MNSTFLCHSVSSVWLVHVASLLLLYILKRLLFAKRFPRNGKMLDPMVPFGRMLSFIFAIFSLTVQ